MIRFFIYMVTVFTNQYIYWLQMIHDNQLSWWNLFRMYVLRAIVCPLVFWTVSVTKNSSEKYELSVSPHCIWERQKISEC